MSTQLIDLESGSVATGDSGERTDADAIKPIDAGERVQAAVIDRPFENLRARTEELRQKVEELLYRADADKWIITGGNTIGQVTVPGAAAFPTVSWNATTGIFVPSAAIVVQPFVSPNTDIFALQQYTFAAASTFILEANDDVLGLAPVLSGDILYDYQLANSIRIIWEVSASLGFGVFCVATLEGSPDHIVRIVIRNDSTTLASHVEAALNTILAPVIAASPIKFSLGGLGTTVIDLADIAGYEDVVLTGTYSRELHRIATAELAAFFAIPAYTLTDDGDGIGIWYEDLIDPDPAERGGRRQATPTTFVDAAPLVLPPNTEVPSSKLFKFSLEPEKIPGCIPLCRRIGTYLVFIDGTIVNHTQTVSFGNADFAPLLARYNAHVGGTAEEHAASDITTTGIAGAPESIGVSEVQSVLAALYGHVNDRVELIPYNAHTGGTGSKHNASAIVYTPSAFPYTWLTDTDVSAVLRAIEYLLAISTTTPDGATYIGAAAIAGTPESVPNGTVRSHLVAIMGDLNDRTERSSTESVDGYWKFKGFEGGTIPPGETWLETIAGKRWGAVVPEFGGNPWAHAGAHQNKYTQNASNWLDICPGWNYTSGYPVIYLLNATFPATTVSIREIDTRNWNMLGTSVDRNVTVPADHIPVSMCCDGPFIYVLCRANVAGTNSAILCYSTNPWNSTPVWTRTCAGYAIGTDISSYLRSKIIIASDTHLAITFGALITSTSPGGAIMAILAKDNSVITYGRGNLDATGFGPSGGLCSDGAHVHFGARKDAVGPANTALASAAIAGPTGGGLYAAPKTESHAYPIHDMIFDGQMVWAIHNGGHISVWHLNPDEFLYDFIDLGDTIADVDDGFGNITYIQRCAIAFDGIHIWVAAPLADSAPRYNRYFSKIDAMAASPNYSNAQVPPKLIVNNNYISGAQIWGRICAFAGRVWAVKCVDSIASPVGTLFVIAKSESRGY